MKTLEQAAMQPGITITEFGLNLHFSPIPNWYGCILGFDCPVCGHPVSWSWEGEMPAFTGENTPDLIKPTMVAAKLIGYGHRWIRLECSECHTKLEAENFD